MNKTASVPGARGGGRWAVGGKKTPLFRRQQDLCDVESDCSTKQIPRTAKIATQRNSISKTNNKINKSTQSM